MCRIRERRSNVIQRSPDSFNRVVDVFALGGRVVARQGCGKQFIAVFQPLAGRNNRQRDDATLRIAGRETDFGGWNP
jgi:hypothetical protein